MAYVSTVPKNKAASCPTACFVWETEKPFQDVSRKSCDFSFLGANWRLEMNYSYKGGSSNSDTYITVTLKKMCGTVSGTSHVDISTIIVACNIFSVAEYYKYQFPIQRESTTVLWEYLTSNCSGLLNKGAWKVICVFYNILPPVYKKDSIKDSSTQFDEDLTPTAEKCTQASSDFSDLEKLSKDFSNLLSLSLHPDAKLRFGDQTLPVHRSVLAARSPVFATMFRDENTDTFDVADVEEKTLNMLLEYAYSGVVRELSDPTAVALYGAGMTYGMDSLRKACSDWMVQHLTPENCVSFLSAASSGDDGPFEEAVASFLCDHPDVFRGSSWDRFAEEHNSLAYKLIHACMLRSLKHR